LKESVTGDPKKLEFHYRLNEAAHAQDYTIFALVLKGGRICAEANWE